MQKNWYIAYTKAKCEKKVAALLTKRKIENFCPINRKEIIELRRKKTVFEPLFGSFLFVNIKESDIALLKRLDNVINVAYWKTEPAIIKEDEIEAIKEFAAHHKNIVLEKIPINKSYKQGITDNAICSIDGHILVIKNKLVKVNLPSLGFRMVAEVKEKGVIGREVVGEKELGMQ